MGVKGNATVQLEYCVPSPKAGGNPSQTDAMVITDTVVLAIEAKWTEPYDKQTVAKRIAKPETDGADPRETVSGWLKHIRPFATHELRLEDFNDVIYQNVHRAASACAVAKKKGYRPQVAYLHFHPSPLKSSATTDQYIADLRHLHGLLGRPAEIKFIVVEMPIYPTKAFEDIKDLDKRSRDTSARVSQALCGGPLFAFGAPTVTQI